MNEAKIDQSSLTDFNDRYRPKTAEGKNMQSANALYEGRELTLNAFRSGIFLLKTKGKGLRILNSKQMLQRLPIALAQVKAGTTSKNILNEVRQIIYSLY